MKKETKVMLDALEIVKNIKNPTTKASIIIKHLKLWGFVLVETR